MSFKDVTDETQKASHADGGSPASEADTTLSLLGGVARPEGMESADEFDAAGLDGPAGRFSALNRGTMLLLVVIVLAVGTLYLMRMGQGKLTGGLSAEIEAKIDTALAKLAKGNAEGGDPNEKINDLFKDTRPMIAVFQQDSAHQQVPIEFVKQNPFFIERAKKIDPVVKTDNTALEAERERERRLKELQKEFSEMRLTSVLLGARPIAIIDNELYQPGAQVGSFTLQSINALSVVLVADGDKYILKLEQDDRGSRSRR